MAPRAHRNSANSVYVRCKQAKARIMKRVKKHGLPEWRTTADMDEAQQNWRLGLGVPLWNEHRADIQLIEDEIGKVTYPERVDT